MTDISEIFPNQNKYYIGYLCIYALQTFDDVRAQFFWLYSADTGNIVRVKEHAIF